jgi:hypothetical protein
MKDPFAHAYEEPDDDVTRPWDREHEYIETYPMRVLPQWITYGLPSPRAAGHYRRPLGERALGVLIISAALVLLATELSAVYLMACESAHLIRLRLG